MNIGLMWSKDSLNYLALNNRLSIVIFELNDCIDELIWMAYKLYVYKS